MGSAMNLTGLRYEDRRVRVGVRVRVRVRGSNQIKFKEFLFSVSMTLIQIA